MVCSPILMKILALLAAATLVSFASAQDAIPPEKQAKIEKLWTLTGLENQMKGASAAGLASMEQQLLRPGMPAAQFTKIRGAIDAVKELTSKELSLATLKPQMLTIYDKAYTTEELDGVLKVLDTPEAALFFTKSGALTAEMAKLNAEAATKLQPKIMELIQKALAP
jgi:hypothetical protein